LTQDYAQIYAMDAVEAQKLFVWWQLRQILYHYTWNITFCCLIKIMFRFSRHLPMVKSYTSHLN